MRMRFLPVKTTLAAAATALLFLSCGHPPKPDLQPDMARADERLAAGDFSTALHSYAALLKRYPGDEAASTRFRSAIEQTKARADQWFEAKEFVAAQETYSLLAASFPQFSSLKEPLSFDREYLSRQVLECRKSLSARRARQSLSKGDFLTALNGYKVLPPAVLRSPGQSASLRQVMEDIWELANQAFGGKDLVAAGKGFTVLWREYPMAQRTGLSLSFSRNDAELKLRSCRAELTRQGLEQYRKSNLKEAIAIWQGLLQFDPGNAEVRKAVATATEQLKKLGKD